MDWFGFGNVLPQNQTDLNEISKGDGFAVRLAKVKTSKTTFLKNLSQTKKPMLLAMALTTLNVIYIKRPAYASLTFTAFNPFFPSCKSKVTSSFSLISSTKPETCTKYSLFVPSSLIKPNPLVELKNFTIPLFIVL